MKSTLISRFRFSSAHVLRGIPDLHPCARLHGHNYAAELHLTGEIDRESGWVMDPYEVAHHWNDLVQSRVDHQFLNEVEGLKNPTVENLAAWIYGQLEIVFRSKKMRVVVFETEQTGAIYPPE